MYDDEPPSRPAAGELSPSSGRLFRQNWIEPNVGTFRLQVMSKANVLALVAKLRGGTSLYNFPASRRQNRSPAGPRSSRVEESNLALSVGCPWVFSEADGMPCAHSTLYRRVTQAGSRGKVSLKVTPHVLRHRAIS